MFTIQTHYLFLLFYLTKANFVHFTELAYQVKKITEKVHFIKVFSISGVDCTVVYEFNCSTFDLSAGAIVIFSILLFNY